MSQVTHGEILVITLCKSDRWKLAVFVISWHDCAIFFLTVIWRSAEIDVTFHAKWHPIAFSISPCSSLHSDTAHGNCSHLWKHCWNTVNFKFNFDQLGRGACTGAGTCSCYSNMADATKVVRALENVGEQWEHAFRLKCMGETMLQELYWKFEKQLLV